jgi:ABC-type branched-subunit amino acid transport system permease subunit
MAVPVFVLSVFVAAAALALWLDVRLGEKGPTNLSHILLHAIGAMLALRAAREVVGAMDGPTPFMVVLIAILMPALMYVFLTSLWMLKMLRGAMPR